MKEAERVEEMEAVGFWFLFFVFLELRVFFVSFGL